MTDTLVFDLTLTLMSYDFCAVCKQLRITQERIERMRKLIFTPERWRRYDGGEITSQELLELLKADAPDLADEFTRFLSRWPDFMLEISDRTDFMRRAKERGYKLYLLSDFPRDGIKHMRGHFDFFELFDGQVVSSECGMLKPSREIFMYLCGKYDITPENAVFFDDLEKNLATARSLGFKTVLADRNADFFADAAALGICI